MREIKNLTYTYILNNNIKTLPLFNNSSIHPNSEDAFYMWIRIFSNVYGEEGYLVKTGEDKWSVIGNDLFDKGKELCQKRKLELEDLNTKKLNT